MTKERCKLCLLDRKTSQAIGYYIIPVAPDQAYSGKITFCKNCASIPKDGGFEIFPLKGFENNAIFVKDGPYKHVWHKTNLVTRTDMTDEWECDKCGRKTTTTLGGPEDDGCTVEDCKEALRA